ncbi:GBS Bsp-like repeat-containing protein, partial [[Clostridium] spiroforme]|nr:GBS Bsp-like repeat-containing protein [Thomasclavelia spiroformis]
EVANNPSGAKKVEIPVWSENNGQDDIIWYEANKDDDTHYSKVISVSEHSKDIGLYDYAAYITANNGIFAGSSQNNGSINVGIKAGSFETEVNENETEV